MEAEKHIKLSLGHEPGEFHLSMDGIAITINLTASTQRSAEARAGEPQTVTQTAPPPIAKTGEVGEGEAQVVEQLSTDLENFRRASQEIYEGLGKLAKDINLSIQDLSLAEIMQAGMSSPGERLDQARNQVTDVMLMTEQATLNIMDLVDEIRDDCKAVQTKLLELAQSQDPGDTEEDQTAFDSEAAEAQTLWDQVLSQAEDLDRLLSPEPSEAGASPGGTPFFPLAEVLQIILEFCSNETVKQHLKAVIAKQDTIFQTTETERALSLLAADLTKEDDFYQLPLEPVLDLLKGHCQDERVQELFTKMATSAGKLFPVSALPLEAQSLQDDFAEDPAPSPGNPEVESRWQELQQNLKLLAETRQTAATCPGVAGHGVTTASVQEVLGTMDHITGSLSRIIEALSFQDLSGQRLLKLLKLLRQLQVQVLTLLVGSGHKLQGMIDDKALSLEECHMAREELDRLLHGFTPDSEKDTSPLPEEQPLDQSAVNDLLTSMGF